MSMLHDFNIYRNIMTVFYTLALQTASAVCLAASSRPSRMILPKGFMLLEQSTLCSLIVMLASLSIGKITPECLLWSSGTLKNTRIWSSYKKKIGHFTVESVTLVTL